MVKTSIWMFWFKWPCRNFLDLSPPTDISNLYIFPLRGWGVGGKLKLSKQPLQIKQTRGKARWSGYERLRHNRTVKDTLGVQWTVGREGDQKLKDLFPTVTFKTCTWEMSSQNIWHWDHCGTCPWHPWVCGKLGNIFLRAHQQTPLTQGPPQNSPLKTSQTLGKEIYFLILMYWSKGQGLVSYSLGTEAGGCHFPALFLSLLSHGSHLYGYGLLDSPFAFLKSVGTIFSFSLCFSSFLFLSCFLLLFLPHPSWQAPSLHSPSTSLQPVGPIFMLSSCCDPGCHYLPGDSVYAWPVPQFCGCHGGDTPWKPGSEGQRGLWFLDLMRL